MVIQIWDKYNSAEKDPAVCVNYVNTWIRQIDKVRGILEKEEIHYVHTASKGLGRICHSVWASLEEEEIHYVHTASKGL